MYSHFHLVLLVCLRFVKYSDSSTDKCLQLAVNVGHSIDISPHVLVEWYVPTFCWVIIFVYSQSESTHSNFILV